MGTYRQKGSPEGRRRRIGRCQYRGSGGSYQEFDALFKELRQKSIKWGRVAAIGIVGAAVGVATGGLAAPYIGGMIGASMGLSGAAATSAGLAALGGVLWLLADSVSSVGRSSSVGSAE